MRIKLDYGRTGLDVDLPDKNVIGPLQIRAAAPIADPEQAIRDVLEQPVGTPPLAQLAKGRKNLTPMEQAAADADDEDSEAVAEDYWNSLTPAEQEADISAFEEWERGGARLPRTSHDTHSGCPGRPRVHVRGNAGGRRPDRPCDPHAQGERIAGGH